MKVPWLSDLRWRTRLIIVVAGTLVLSAAGLAALIHRSWNPEHISVCYVSRSHALAVGETTVVTAQISRNRHVTALDVNGALYAGPPPYYLGPNPETVSIPPGTWVRVPPGSYTATVARSAGGLVLNLPGQEAVPLGPIGCA